MKCCDKPEHECTQISTEFLFLLFSVADSDRDQEDSHVFSQTRDSAVSKHTPPSSCVQTESVKDAFDVLEAL